MNKSEFAVMVGLFVIAALGFIGYLCATSPLIMPEDLVGPIPPRAGTATPPEAPDSTVSSDATARTAPRAFKLHIFRCSDPMMWYGDKIGTNVPYLGVWPGEGYASREPAGFVNVIRFEDAYIVDEKGVRHVHPKASI